MSKAPAPMTKEAMAAKIEYHAKHSSGVVSLDFGKEKAFRAAAAAVKEQLLEKWDRTYRHFAKVDPKQIHYLSMEYLLGRLLRNSVGSLCLTGQLGEALKEVGWKLEEIETEEADAALGNGGLGRLAACYMESVATLDLPGWGYTLRYKFGLFKQLLDAEGRQHEIAEPWLEHGNPWEAKRVNVRYPICLGGTVDQSGNWKPKTKVEAVAYDIPIPGYKTNNVISLRCWDAEPITGEFDMFKFNEGDYAEALETTVLCQKITSVLYPGDHKREGKALRLMQQYLLSSASVQDIVARFEERARVNGKPVNWDDLPNKVTIQMNDTHPTLAAPELQRILVDEKKLPWEQAFRITSKVVAYTNHTLMPEALECWALSLLEELLPRHVQIIKRIDAEFIDMVRVKLSSKLGRHDIERSLDNMTILKNYYRRTASRSLLPQAGDAHGSDVDDAPKPVVRMANLCVICGFAVNGVAALHSELCKHKVFVDFYNLWPEKFQNKTNGVTPRRWLAFCNPQLSDLITEALGSDAWIKDAKHLAGLQKFADDAAFADKWHKAKAIRKQILWDHIQATAVPDVKGPAVTDIGEWMFDIQIKRMHEYKRQLLNLLSVLHRYRKYKAMSPSERAQQVPRVVIIGGKAFYSYWAAKECVFLTSAIGRIINNDPDMAQLMRVYFMPNYSVSLAEKLIPAAELTQQISTAGTEASGTSNMKFQMNGCLLIGTLDGANVEIRECVGAENFFLFGITADQVDGLREERRLGKFTPSQAFLDVKEWLKSGTFGDFAPLMGTLEGNEGFGRGDWFLLAVDFDSYIAAQAQADAMFKDRKKWTRASIWSTATSSKFSSDRSIMEYADQIWNLKPCPVPDA